MLERKVASLFRKDLNNIYGDKVDVIPLIDSPKQQKKPFDFFILYKTDTRPIFIAFEMKRITGMTFNKDAVKSHQKDFFMSSYIVGDDLYLHTWSLILLYVEKLNVIAAINQLDYDLMFCGDNPSIKINNFDKNFINYSTANNISGSIIAVNRTKVLFADGSYKTAYNCKKILEHYNIHD